MPSLPEAIITVVLPFPYMFSFSSPLARLGRPFLEHMVFREDMPYVMKGVPEQEWSPDKLGETNTSSTRGSKHFPIRLGRARANPQTCGDGQPGF